MELLNARLRDLEGRLVKVESSEDEVQAKNGGAEDLLIEYKTQLLCRLKEIREALLAQGGEGGGDMSMAKMERDALTLENATMKKEIERLNYRVAHLVKALNEEESHPKL